MNVDLIVTGKLVIDELSLHGKTQQVLGGSAAYTAMAAAAMGCRVTVTSTIGDDFPQDFLDLLEDRGVDLSGVTRRRGASHRFHAKIGPKGAILNAHFQPGVGERPPLRKILDLLEEARCLHLGAYRPAVQRDLLAAVKEHHQQIFTSAATVHHYLSRPRSRTTFAGLLKSLSLIFLNEREALLLSGEEDPGIAASCIGRRVPITVVTRGKAGALVCHPASSTKLVTPIPAPPVHQLDPTGAGDSFAGAFLAAYLNGLDPVEAAYWGVAAGSLCITGLGPTSMAKATHDKLRILVELAKTRMHQLLHLAK